MVIDTSALVAIMFDEVDAAVYETTIAHAQAACMSTATALECSLVLEGRHGPPGGDKLDVFISEQGIEVIAFDIEQLAVARGAFRRFGRGRHPAALNYGDCFAYALAKVRGVSLLFKGNDFSQTDIASVL